MNQAIGQRNWNAVRSLVKAGATNDRFSEETDALRFAVEDDLGLYIIKNLRKEAQF